MKKSTQALLLSALALPGAGHLYLKKYFTGFILAGISFFIIAYLANKILETALSIVEKIQSGQVQLDTITISGLASTGTGASNIELLNKLSMLLLICWIIGIVDTYRITRKQK